ncbi:NADH-quinone oxidoreductase subunit C [Geotoga petraea]|uniref:NADH-quinone oxidoreductase subunit C n=1 Tax=Geotoga petraea TaxID=28234 RepID=A0A1G6P2J9_9BACT|nr:NADH-quinone oxidoreductase subunit C [Geotoga petraea]SDC74403.1 NADH-quinone oxidoreductase subunit C [Geotoga petraea]
MNSTNNIENIIESLKNKFELIKTETPIKNQIAIEINKKDFQAVLSFIKNEGWRQMTLITCIDWIKENKYELAYTFMNWENAVTLIVRTKIDREEPKFETITHLYPGAKFYERDVHEFFGVKFEGNKVSEKPLFLELWDDMPPMKKDFDPLEYSKRKYPDREYKVDFKTGEGETNG